MSGLLAGKVWQSNLEAHLKPLAAAMADIANDDGTKIYPSVAYLAWLLGKGERSVQHGLAELKTLGVIQAIAFEKGGRNHPTEYRLLESKLPHRAQWQEVRKGATSAPFSGIKGATNDIKGCSLEQERVQLATERVKPTAPDPLVEPLVEPSITSLPPAARVFERWRETLGHPKSALDPKRLKAINARLRDGYSVDDLFLAIEGCTRSPYHMGQNERHTVFDDIELICRDAGHVDMFIKLTRNGNGKHERVTTREDIEREFHDYSSMRPAPKMDVAK